MSVARLSYKFSGTNCVGNSGTACNIINNNNNENADKTKYRIMSRDQNAGRSYNMKIYNSSTDRVEEFKYLGTTLTNRNSIQEEITSRLRLGNACCYSVQSLLSSSLLSKKLKI